MTVTNIQRQYAIILEMTATMNAFRDNFTSRIQPCSFVIKDEIVNNYNQLGGIVTQIKLFRQKNLKKNVRDNLNQFFIDNNDCVNNFMYYEKNINNHILDQINETNDIDDMRIENENKFKYIKDTQKIY